MFNVCGVAGDSLLRFQVFAGLAYGAQGLWYFTYADGLRKGTGGETTAEVRRALLPTWHDAAAANRRVAAYGPALLGRLCAGVLHTSPRVARGGVPGSDRLVVRLSPDLLAGVLTKPGEPPLLVVVDTRVSKVRDTVPERSAEVQCHPAVTGIEVRSEAGRQTVAGTTVALSLRGGEGLLLALRGEGLDALCAELEVRDAPTARTPVRPDGLVLQVPFDEGTGDVAHDRSGLGHDLALQGTEWVQGRAGKAVGLAGQGTFGRRLETDLRTDTAMSIAAWVRPRYPATGYGPIVYVGSGSLDRFEFGVGPDNLYPVITDHLSHSGGQLYVAGMRALIPDGRWGHIAVCAGPEGAVTYVNAKAVARTGYIGRFDFGPTDVLVGIRGSEEYAGDLSDLRIWNRCLGPAEVAALASEQ
jgi:hypothetical protein